MRLTILNARGDQTVITMRDDHISWLAHTKNRMLDNGKGNLARQEMNDNAGKRGCHSPKG